MNRVENFEGILSFMCEDFNRSIKLTKYMKDDLTEIYGKHNRTFKGEFNYYVWDIEFEGEVFNLYTAKNKGTNIEIDSELNSNKVNTIKRFLTQLENKIK